MREAIGLALRGGAATFPNPRVGCIIVGNGKIVGRGYHRQPGLPHAEIEALRRAGAKARGSTLYVSLEPLSPFRQNSSLYGSHHQSRSTSGRLRREGPESTGAGKGSGPVAAGRHPREGGPLRPGSRARERGVFQIHDYRTSLCYRQGGVDARREDFNRPAGRQMDYRHARTGPGS